MKQEEDFEANLAGEEGQSEETKSSWFKRIKKGILTSTAEKGNTRRTLEQMPGMRLYMYRDRAPGKYFCVPQMQLPSPHRQFRVF